MRIKKYSDKHSEVFVVSGKNIKDSRGTFKKTIYGENLKKSYA